MSDLMLRLGELPVVEMMQKVEPQDLVAFVPDLVLRLDDDDPEVRCNTLNVLGRLPPAQLMEIVPSLLIKLKDSAAAVRQAALLTMKKPSTNSLLTVAPVLRLPCCLLTMTKT